MLESRAEGKPVSVETLNAAIEASKSVLTFDEVSFRDLEENTYWPPTAPESEKSPERKYKDYQN